MNRMFIWCFGLTLLIAACGTEHTIPPGDSVTKTIVTAGGDTIQIQQNGDTVVRYSNTRKDCSILTRKLPADTASRTFGEDIRQLYGCGVDSFDLVYVVPNLLPGFAGEQYIAGNTSATYGDFVKHLNEFKLTEAYAQLHVQVKTLDSLRSVSFNALQLPNMKPTFGRLGMTEPEWQQFSGFARTYPVPQNGVFTWGDMLNAFETYSAEYQQRQRKQ